MPAPRTPLALLTYEQRSDRLSREPRTGGLDRAEKPPSWLPTEGKREWRRIVGAAQTAHAAWLQQTDRGALAAYCSAWSTFVEAMQDVARRGVIVPGRSSADAARGDDDSPAMVKNPAVTIARDASVLMRSWAVQLGFTPDARGRANLAQVAVQDDDEDDPFD